jgi:osmotically-inducible protein OsmY
LEDFDLRVSIRSAIVLAAGAASLCLSLTSCVVPIVAGGAASTGYVVGQERDVSTQVNDNVIRAGINDKWMRFNSDMAHQLSLSVYDGRVLIVGVVANPEWKTEAVRLAWEVKGVKEVNSEIELSASQGLGDTARDELITTRLRSALLLDGQIRSINYTIDTVNGSVYLSGSARSQAELDKVTNYARNIPNVKRVVSYVRIRTGEPATPAAPASVSAPAPAPATTQGVPPSGSQTTPQTIVVPPAAPTNVAPPPATPGGPAKIEVQPL